MDALVTFTIGMKYMDAVCCDVVPTDACQLLLRWPLQYDLRVVHYSCMNYYNFAFKGVKIMLLPNKALEKPPSTNTNIKMLSYTLFGREL